MTQDLTFRMQLFVEADADTIWGCLTEGEKLGQWWDPIESGVFEQGTTVVLAPSAEVKIDCKVLESVRPKKLVYTFDCDAYPDHPESQVTWTIEEVPGGCMLAMAHEKYPDPNLGLNDVCKHWPNMIANLKRLAEGVPLHRFEVQEA